MSNRERNINYFFVLVALSSNFVRLVKTDDHWLLKILSLAPLLLLICLWYEHNTLKKKYDRLYTFVKKIGGA